ncbi:MAG: zinc-dependent alcohol dehydrogenase family protein [Anaerolineae bacterium]|nr:zinc-dependent alcohol dehydrogenase family protein [Anaerolineae bacterium]
MKAAVFDDFQQPISVRTVPDPEPPPDGVVIAVTASGLCRSDWHGWMGHDADVHPPHVPGHEFAGRIVAVGPDVRNWEAGARVTAPFALGCGRCAQCVAGNQQICDAYYQPGFTGWGSFAEYVAIPYADTNLVRLPDTVDDLSAATLGCRFTTSFRAVIDQGRLRAGEWAVIYGCGGVGLSAVMIARAQGAQVIAVDIDDAALALAQQMGAGHIFNARKDDDVPAAVAELTGGGAHLSVDALGSHETARNAILSLRKQGRHVQVGLLGAEGGEAPVPMGRIIAHELELYGSHGMQAHHYPRLLEMIASGVLDPGQLVQRTISLAGAPEALVAMGQFAQPGVTVVNRF